jgi:Caudovirus prohead protease.
MIQIKNFRAKFTAPDDEGHFTGYASVFELEDLDGDIIKPGAFKKTLTERKIPISLATHGNGANWLGRDGRG